MREHRAAVQQKLVQQEADGLHRLNLDSEQVLARLWEIANLSPERTRGSLAGQVKAISIIVAMQSFIPNRLEARLAVSPEKNPATPPANPQIYVSAWRAAQQAATTAAQPAPTPARQEDSPGVPEPEPRLNPGSGEGPPPDPGTSHSTIATDVSPSQPQPPPPFVPLLTHVPDARAPFSTNRYPFARRR